ncbi:MAG: hypothetical protein J6X61_01010 [Clostridia bacterium]|nr:hypothetical protein [Clostridia bacterium]
MHTKLLSLLCILLALSLLAGCAGGDPTASSAAVSSLKGESATATSSDESVSEGSASSAAAGVIADIPQKPADAGAVSQTEAGKQSSFNVSKTGTLQAYPEYDERIERDYTYTVTVTQGSNVRSLTCYNHCDAVATSDRTVNGDSVRRFCEFAFADAPVRIDIAVKQDFKTYTVMPTAKGFQSELHGNVVSIYMEKPDYALLKLDNKDDSILAIFADEPEVDVPKKGDRNVIYVEGWYEPDDWHLDLMENNTTLYLAPGSVLCSRVVVRGQNVTIKGRGMILDPISNLYGKYPSNTDFKLDTNANQVARVLNIRGGLCKIDGIKMIDARGFTLIVSAYNVKVTNFKALSSQMCTDGITQYGDNNTYVHCFIYNGDNGVVFTGGNKQTYRDITVGSICAATYPQVYVGNVDWDGLYVFRADEGLMRNIHNPTKEQRSFNLTISNISCVDCDHFPFIFMGGNMGDAAKTITFKNLAVPYATGANNQFTANENKKTLQKLSNATYNLATSNYTMNFAGLSIGGKAVTGADQIPVDPNYRGSLFHINVSGNGATWPATSNVITANVVAPGKIFIGNRQLFLKDAAVEQNGTWYVPAADVCKALGCSVPSGTTKIGGTAYLSLDALKASGCTTSATYDSGAKAIRIAHTDHGANLLAGEGTAAHSRWSELICYNIHMLYHKDAAGDYFQLLGNDASTGNGAGASYILTQQIQQCGTGNYKFTAYMKANKATTAKISVSVNKADKFQTTTLSTEWQKVELTFNVTNAADVTNACLKIMCTENNPNVCFKDASLVHTK